MNSFKIVSISTSIFFLVSTAAIAAEAAKKYQFQSSPSCALQKRVNKEWKKADPREIEHSEPFLLHETFNHPELSTFYANHEAYAAPTECFSEEGKPVLKPEGELARNETKRDETKEQKEEDKAEEKKEEKKEEEIEEENESEFLHQARFQILEITPSVGFISSTGTYKNFTLSSAKTTGITTGAVLEYGLTEHISLGANVNYDHLSTSTTPSSGASTTQKGFEDPRFFLNGKTEFGNSEVRLNILFDTAFAHSRTEANGDSNVESGSFVITPAIGYEYHQGHNIFGAQVAYDAVKSDAKHDAVDGTGAVTMTAAKGGKAAIGALFFEHRFRKGEFGFSYQYAKVNHTTEEGVDLNNGGILWTATLYGEIEFNERVSLLPAVSFAKANFEEDLDNGNVDNIKNITGSLGARFKF